MLKSRPGLILSLLLLACGAALLVWGTWPASRKNQIFLVPRQAMDITSSNQNRDGLTLSAGLLQVHFLRSERIRLGQAQELSAEITLIAPGNPNMGDAQGNIQTTVTSDLVDLFASYNLVAEARVDGLPTALVPSGSIRQPISLGVPIEYRWSFDPQEPGQYEGELWIYLNLVDKEIGTNEQVALLAYPFAINCRSFLGLKTAYVLGMGSFFIFLSLLLNVESIENIVIKHR
jgi:hypothetical protein